MNQTNILFFCACLHHSAHGVFKFHVPCCHLHLPIIHFCARVWGMLYPWAAATVLQFCSLQTSLCFQKQHALLRDTWIPTAAFIGNKSSQMEKCRTVLNTDNIRSNPGNSSWRLKSKVFWWRHRLLFSDVFQVSSMVPDTEWPPNPCLLKGAANVRQRVETTAVDYLWVRAGWWELCHVLLKDNVSGSEKIMKVERQRTQGSVVIVFVLISLSHSCSE